MASLRHAPGIAREAGCTGVVAFFTLPSGLVARWLNSRLNLPYLVSLRGSDVPGHDRTLDRMHALTRPIRRAVLRRASALVANSDGLAATSRAADPFPIEVVPNGVDCSRFTPAPVAPPPGRFRLLFVGRVHREKNLRPVVEALRELPQVGLIVAGDGPQRAELEALAVHQGVAERIQWLGWQGKAALPELYRGAHALINPSLYEGMPNVVLEGMASGLAVIGSDTPGNRSVIADRETGLLFPLGDDRALADCIRGISRDEALRKRLAANGRLSAERNFSWDKSAAHYLELLGRSGR
jgi:glycosyltransferase involved in cell wall biosynthesis